jgi:hypothetical protein
MPPRIKIDEGQVFGRLTVISKEKISGWGTRYRCSCQCDGETMATASNLKSGNTKSCGCYFDDTHTTHGQTGSRAYVSWKAMFQRCKNPKAKFYPHYGGRGIKVCERWEKFESFLADMGHPPTGHTLDRKEVNGDYTPENCKWSTHKEQLNNRRNNVYITAFGNTKTLTQWAEEYKIPVTTLRNRIQRAGMSPENALTANAYYRQRGNKCDHDH